MKKLSKNALTVLERRYLKKDETGKVIETPQNMFSRVAVAVAQADLLYEEKNIINTQDKFFDVMSDLNFLPSSPILMNAGREIGQLSACFVLPIEDSIDSIYDAIKQAAIIHQSGGGTGFSFSRLRPKNDIVKKSQGISSGPISFMKIFNASTEEIKQGGRRKGANLGLLRIDHPDILEFIKCKEDLKEFNNFNISVAITDDFMTSLELGTNHVLINPRDNKVVGELDAKKVFDSIVKMAWKNGEPGIIFIDTINKYHPWGEIESCNPCGEQPLLPFESCNLGSINLSNMVDGIEIDYFKLENTIKTAVHFLNNIIDINKYPLPEIEKITKQNRKIGLGVMGFADMLIKLGIKYDSVKAEDLAKKIMCFINKKSHEFSKELCERRNIPVNMTRMTIAPTGTLSIIANCSSGIEPLYSLDTIKTVMDNDVLEERTIYKDVDKSLLRTAHDIDPMWHLKIQAAFQKYTDNAISKTINLKKDATEEDVRKVYLKAYEWGCKGVTVYRDGSRENQVLTTKKDKKDNKVIPTERPDMLCGFTHKITTGCGTLYVTINRDQRGVCELFTTMGKAGGCASSQAETIGRLISLALRSNVDLKSVIKQLKGVRCPKQTWHNGKLILSCTDAIAKILSNYIEKKVERNIEKNNEICPECNNIIEYIEGCLICKSCGYSKC